MAALIRNLSIGSGGSARRSFGHSVDGTRIVQEEADAIRDAAQRVLAGETLSSIIASWNGRGLRTAIGGPWRVNSLSTLLLQPRLAGLDTKLGGPRPGRPEPVLDLDTHRRLLDLHESRRKGPRRPTRRYLLTGLLRCWRCGGRLRGMPSSRGSDLYVCPGPPHGGCSGTAVTADRADLTVRDMVLVHVDADDFVGTLSGARFASRDEVDMRRAARQLAEHRQRLLDLAQMWAGGEITRAEWESLRRTLDRRARQAEHQTALLSTVNRLRHLAGNGAALRRRWETMTVDEQRTIVHAPLDHVVVMPAEPPRQVFRPGAYVPSGSRCPEPAARALQPYFGTAISRNRTETVYNK